MSPTVDGVPSYARDEGTGTPTLFLHSNPDSVGLWAGVLPPLRDHFRCLVPDLPGFRLTRWAGELQVVTGVAHLALGVVAFRRTLVAIARDGVVGVSDGDWERETAVWFLTSGAGFLLTGQLARWAQRRVGTLPAAYGVGLLALGLVGVIVMPRSGFWVVAANGLLALAAARAGATRADTVDELTAVTPGGTQPSPV